MGELMGNLRLAFFLAYKSILKGNRWTLALVILVMSLSFANLVLVPSILAGVTIAIDQEQIYTLYGNIVIDPLPKDYYLRDLSRIENQIDQIPGIAGVAPHLNSTAFFEYKWQQNVSPGDKGISGNWNVVGIEPEEESNVTTISDSLIAGDYLAPGDRDKIVLGVEIAGGSQADNQPFLTLEGVGVGDKVRLTYSNGVRREYTVKGIFKARQISVNSQAYVTFKEMASVLGPAEVNDSASQILIRTGPGSDAGQILAELKTLGINGQIRSWEDYGGIMGGVVSSFNAIASLIGAIGLIVAAVVMFIVIYINAIHRKRQIGILRAIGINRNVVLASYLLQALLYSVLGIILGGLIFGYVIKPYFDLHPIDLPVGLVSLSISSSTVLVAIIGLLGSAVMAGIIPILSITRESIIKAIWGN
jgi:putative ABC transport system permease protein